MAETDKEQFGKFITELRKQKGLTQKELAEKLYISDKAVSKWECGKGLPDISLLIPLADIFGATVTELLKAQRLSSQEPLKAEEIDEVVKMAITISTEEDNPILATKSKRAAVYLLCVIITCAEIGILFALGHSAAMIINGILTVFAVIFIPVYVSAKKYE